jgi:outer membrane autotransporter protein
MLCVARNSRQAGNCFKEGRVDRRYTKTIVSNLLSGVALTCFSLSASQAQTVGNYTPSTNSQQVGAQSFSDGAAHTIGGGYQTITGSAADWDYPALIELENQGRLVAVDGAAGGSVVGKVVLATGGRVLNTSYRDPITGATQNVSVFNSNNFNTTDFSVRGNSTSAKTWTLGIDQGYYLDGRIATVTNGSTLNVVVGDPTAEPKAVPGNTLTMFSKQTSVYRVEGAAGGTINYNSNTWFDLGTSEAERPGSEVNPTTGQATGTFSETKFDRGVTFPTSTWINPATGATETIPGGTVTDLASFRNYNNYLIGRLQAGALNISDYAARLQSAYSTTTFTATYQAAPDQVTAPTLWAPLGQRALVAVDGPNSVVNFGVDSKVKDATLITAHHIAYATGGATVNNEGKLSAGANGTSNGFAGDGLILAESGSRVFNRASGSISNYDPGTYQPNSTAGLTGVNNSVAVMLYGNGTSFQNEGIINVAGGGNSQNNGFQAGIYLKNGAPTATNTGVINVAVNGSLSDTTVYGVGMEGRSIFINDGEIHIGRTGQYSLNDPTTDVSNNLAHIYGIGGGGGVQMVNNGLITIGSLTGGASAMRMANSDAASVATNAGTITINGALSTMPLQNIGMELRNAGGTNRNSGTINLNGVNAVGIHLLSGSSFNTSVSNTGVINVGGGADPATGTRNYGVWAEGNNGRISTANIDGQINLTGVGGIGVHARGTSVVNVAATAAPNFISGSDQIGFFIYGPDAVVNVAATNMDVATARSTLFRVADGADYDAPGTTITVSGTDAIGIVGTGVGTDVQTRDGTFNLTGDGATAVVIEGGASATILPITNINLNAPNTVAGIVDGQKHDLYGAPVGAPDPTTLITNAADIGSSQAGVTGFIARNLGTLNTSGNISLAGAGSTGILAQDSGKVVVNGSTVNVNGWAARAQGGADTFTLAGATLRGTDGVFDVSGSANATFAASASTLTGRILTAAGSISNVSLTSGTTWNMDADSNVTALVNNASTINFTPPVGGVFKNLTVDGDYTGTAGTLVLNTHLGTDGSPSDKLIINGGTATGSTSMVIRNAAGAGALTTGDGILVVDAINGGTTATGAFALGGRVAAGAYEYTLHRSGAADAQDWFLRSSYTGPVDTPTSPANPSTPPGEPPQAPVSPAAPATPNYRVEVPVDMAVPALANRFGLQMLGTYHDRVGEEYVGAETPAKAQEIWCKDPARNFRCTPTAQQSAVYADSASGTQRSLAGWGRIFGETGNVKSGNAGYGSFAKHGPSYDFGMAGFQAGLDLYRNYNADGSHDTAGLYIGAGRVESDVNAVYGGHAGKVEMDGYSAGAYWTRKGASGWYVDAVVQGTWYDRIRARSASSETLRSNGWGLTASLEAGYPIALGSGWTIEPQAQIIYQRVSLDGGQDSFGLVNYDDTDAIYGRLGARLTKGWALSDGRQITTWARANIWHSFGADATTTFSSLTGLNPVALKTDLGGTWAQFGAGISGQVTKNVSVFASGDYSMAMGGGKGQSVGGRVGLKVVW